ncbi:MAG: signal peptidase II [Candidatus Rokuibacteriota bacterium]
MHGLQAPRGAGPLTILEPSERGRRAWLRVYGLLLGVALAILVADQITKELAIAALSDGHIDLVEGVLTLRITLNPGGAFGFLPGIPELFLVATALVILLILVWAHRIQRTGLAAALGLVLGGGLGNLFDRIFRDFGGRVVDFVDLHVWPVFNLADSAIVVGVAAILWLSRDRGAGEPRS